jgi:hypothetical protein
MKLKAVENICAIPNSYLIVAEPSTTAKPAAKPYLGYHLVKPIALCVLKGEFWESANILPLLTLSSFLFLYYSLSFTATNGFHCHSIGFYSTTTKVSVRVRAFFAVNRTDTFVVVLYRAMILDNLR